MLRANRFQGDTSDGKHLMSPKFPSPPDVQKLSQWILLSSPLAPGSDTDRKEDPNAVLCPLPDILPSPLEQHILCRGVAHPSPYLKDSKRHLKPGDKVARFLSLSIKCVQGLLKAPVFRVNSRVLAPHSQCSITPRGTATGTPGPVQSAARRLSNALE